MHAAALRTLAASFLLMTAAPHAHAYIDPGTGMLLLQGLLAALGAFLVFVKHPVQTVKNLFRKWFGKKDERS